MKARLVQHSIIADLRQGSNIPVIYAKVTAIIERSVGPNVELSLFDNGVGADFIRNDGIYSR